MLPHMVNSSLLRTLVKEWPRDHKRGMALASKRRAAQSPQAARKRRFRFHSCFSCLLVRCTAKESCLRSSRSAQKLRWRQRCRSSGESQYRRGEVRTEHCTAQSERNECGSAGMHKLSAEARKGCWLASCKADPRRQGDAEHGCVAEKVVRDKTTEAHASRGRGQPTRHAEGHAALPQPTTDK